MLEQAVDTLRHLRRRLVGERHRHNGIGRNAAHLDEIGDAVGNDPRLARAGTSQDQQRAIYCLHGGTLLGVQFVE